LFNSGDCERSDEDDCERSEEGDCEREFFLLISGDGDAVLSDDKISF
ncbi:unnamed protein product, partial [Rotaria magnacalcarata]